MAIVVVAVRRVWVAIIGIGYAALHRRRLPSDGGTAEGLFNFKESWAAPFADLAFGVEIAAIVVLLVAGALCLLGARLRRAERVAPVGADEVRSLTAGRRKGRPRA